MQRVTYVSAVKNWLQHHNVHSVTHSEMYVSRNGFPVPEHIGHYKITEDDYYIMIYFVDLFRKIQ